MAFSKEVLKEISGVGMNMKNGKIEAACLYCGKKFIQKKSEIHKNKKRGTKNIGMFCSRCCSTKHRISNIVKPKSNVVCAKCGKWFYKSNSKKNNSKSGLFFCSRSCKDLAQSFENGIREIWPNHYGDGKRIKYRKLAINYYGGRCVECGLDIVEILIVHHKDGNRHNNAIGNLEVLCPNHHAIRHCKNGHFNTKNINGVTA